MAVNLKGRSVLSLMDFSVEEVRHLLDLSRDPKATIDVAPHGLDFHTQTNQPGSNGPLGLPVFHLDGPQPSPDVAVHVLQRLLFTSYLWIVPIALPSSQAAGGKSEAFAVLQSAEHPVVRPVHAVLFRPTPESLDSVGGAPPFSRNAPSCVSFGSCWASWPPEDAVP
ncbi:MAG: hypothetical protein P4L36_22505 [Holophaga sp.]|nr:hypothetical protein [Holophaga sp.]